jgi:predicted AlkP superfamily phosphohydrolase/phosphomutase
MEALLALRDPETGGAVVAQAWRKEELYQGPQLPWLPDILFQISPHPYLPTDRLSVDALFEPIAPSVGGGRHRPEGILIAAGAPFRQGENISGARIADITPTVLYLLGLPVPEDMDGRVLKDLFKPDYLQSHPILQGPPVGDEERPGGPSPYSEEEMDQIAENLRGLGYL